MELFFTQSWLPDSEPGFQPGTASFTWKEGTLDLTVDLEDKNILTKATAHGERLWEHGDVAELFIQKIGEESYREYQLSPNGFTLALSYPDLSGVVAVRSGEQKIEDFFSQTNFEARTELTATGWRAHFLIPLSGSPGDRIRISCCRYDAAEDRAPMISSTSHHTIRDFHRPQEWREFVL